MSATDTAETVSPESTRAREIGRRLRNIRAQQRLSLVNVEQRSGGEWKAVVIGAYERGDRAITVGKLAKLAAFYGVPLVDLLPMEQGDGADEAEGDPRIVIDLTRLEGQTPEVQAVSRFAAHVRQLRGDHNGRVLTLRGGDLTTIGLAAGMSREALQDALAREGALLASGA
jgi:transcriptional regulator with XRE-family HTH domain